jgi:Na+/H+ antiporter NhaB
LSEEDLEASRKSYLNEELPRESRRVMNEMKESAEDSREKQELLLLLLAESVFSNWHYITYFVLVMIHVHNMGLLTLPLPLIIFCCGLVSSERAGKSVWRALLASAMVPILFKFALGTGIV